MAFDLLKGSSDYKPEEMYLFMEIIRKLEEKFISSGFKPMDTPIIEFLDTLTLKYDDDAEIVNEIFKVSDRGNRKLGLRYDLTTPLCRFISSNPHLKKPFRRFQYGKVFRDGPLKKGRAREFYQFDVDIVGESSIFIEAELLKLFFDSYKGLNIEPIIEINNNKILRGVLLQNGAREEDLSSYILSVDKLKKIGKDNVIKEIKEKGLDVEPALKSIEEFSINNINKLKEIERNEILKEGILELENLIGSLEFLEINYRINFSLSRGLDIYTGNIWEAYDSLNRINSSIGAGGRYDKVIGEFISLKDKKNKETEEIPAVGVSFGLVPIMTLIQQENNLPIKSKTQILFVPLNEESVNTSIKLSNSLRDRGFNTELFYAFSMKKAFKYCDYNNIEKIIFFGKDDIKENLIKVKNLKTKEIEEIKFNNNFEIIN